MMQRSWAAAATSGRSTTSRRCNAREPRFDCLLHFLVKFPGVLAGGFDGIADDHANRAGLFQEAAPWPECPGVVRQRHHALAGGDREHRAAGTELARVTRNHPGAFRKDDDPKSVPKP